MWMLLPLYLWMGKLPQGASLYVDHTVDVWIDGMLFVADYCLVVVV